MSTTEREYTYEAPGRRAWIGPDGVVHHQMAEAFTRFAVAPELTEAIIDAEEERIRRDAARRSDEPVISVEAVRWVKPVPQLTSGGQLFRYLHVLEMTVYYWPKEVG